MTDYPIPCPYCKSGQVGVYQTFARCLRCNTDVHMSYVRMVIRKQTPEPTTPPPPPLPVQIEPQQLRLF